MLTYRRLILKYSTIKQITNNKRIQVIVKSNEMSVACIRSSRYLFYWHATQLYQYPYIAKEKRVSKVKNFRTVYTFSYKTDPLTVQISLYLY